MKRLFVAVKVVPDEVFLSLYYNLKSACRHDRINWVKPENIHITLKFLGDTNEAQIPEIIDHLSQITPGISSFEIFLEGVGIFGSSYKPRVIWVGIRENEFLNTLGQKVLDTMDVIGFPQDRQNFVPHLTLGRIKYTDNKQRFFENIQKLKEVKILTQKVDQILLYESKLSSEGPEYTVLGAFELKKA